MKEEEFNEFLRQKAEGFEITPSSGSFASVMRKMENKRKKRGLIVWLPLLAAVSAGILTIAIQSNNNTPLAPAYNNTAVTIPQPPITADKKQSNTTTAENTTGSQYTITNNTASTDKSFAGSQQVTPKNVRNTTIKTLDNTKTSTDDKKDEVSTIYTEVVDDTKQTPAKVVDSSQIVIAQNDVIAPSEIVEDEKTTEFVEMPDPKTQNIKPEKKGKGCNCGEKWTISAFYNPFAADYYRTVSKSEPTTNTVTQSNNISSSNFQKYSYASDYTYANGFDIGTRANYKFTSNFGVSAGISYSKRAITGYSKITAIENDSVEDTYYDPATNQPYTLVRNVFQGEKIVDESYTTTLQSIKLPVALTYTVQKNRWGFDAEIGGSLDYLFSAKTETKNHIKPAQFNLTTSAENETVTTAETKNYRTWNIMASVAGFVTYKPGKCWGIYIGPRATAALRPVNNNTNNGLQKELPLFLGLETGLKINL